MQIPVLTYVSADTPLHRCDARVKIAVLFAFSIGVFVVQGWPAMIGMALVVGIALAVGKLPLGLVNRLLTPVYVLAAFTVLFHVLAAPGIDSLLAGLFVGVRMVVLVAASFVVCLSSTSSQVLGAFRWFIGPLRHLHVPVDDIAFTLALSLRFIPLIEAELLSVRAAQKSRGAELAGSPYRKLQIWGAAFSAVFVGMFRHADAVAVAMDARCYGAKDARAQQD